MYHSVAILFFTLKKCVGRGGRGEVGWEGEGIPLYVLNGDVRSDWFSRCFVLNDKLCVAERTTVVLFVFLTLTQ